MPKIVECVPNISEGRRPDVVEQVVAEVKKVKGVKLLDFSSDQDHNRSVITFAGDPDACAKAAFGLIKCAITLIDLTKHKGAHPRVGAVDVVPFVPVQGMEMDECVALARGLGKRVWEELRVPVYLYEYAASAPHRRNLPDIREGEFEGLSEKMQEERWHPDFGGNSPHPTAGATVIGARNFLIAYNINLDTPDMKVCRKVANSIREKKGGLVNIRAMAVKLDERKQTQVSINMVSPFETPMYRVFELVRLEAARYGVRIVGSEVVGLVPMEALADTARYYLQLEDFKTEQVLETGL